MLAAMKTLFRIGRLFSIPNLPTLFLVLIPALLGAELVTHRVEAGDTLYSLGRRYGVTVEQIRELNQLGDNTIGIGQILKIKDDSGNSGIPVWDAGHTGIRQLQPDSALPRFLAGLDNAGRWQIPRRLPENALVAEDATGRLFLAGDLEGNMTFGGLTLSARSNPEQEAGAGVCDTWLACQDSLGNWLWAKHLALTQAEDNVPLALAAEPSGSLYVALVFSGVLELGAEKFGAEAGSAVLLAKFDGLGNLLWTKQANCSETLNSPSLAFGADRICLAGEFSGTLNLDAISLTAGGESDIFMAWFDPEGTWLSAQKTGGPKNERLITLEPAKDGGMMVWGSSSSELRLGSGNVGSKPDSAGNTMFLARLGADGQWNWASRVQQLRAASRARPFTTDARGFTWFCENYYGDPLPDPVYAGAMSVNSSLSLLDSSGRKLWSRNLDGRDVSIDRISAGQNADVFVAGTFSGGLELGSHKLSSGAGKAQFYARFDQSGNCLWARKWLGTDLHFLEAGPAGQLFLVAKYRPHLDSGGQPFYLEQGEGRLAVACLDQLGNWNWVAQSGSESSPGLLGVYSSPKGDLRILGSCPGTLRFYDPGP